MADDNNSPKPREITGSCILGAAYAPDIGFLNGHHARARTQPDPSNMVPQSYYYEPYGPLVSPRLKSVAQSSGGLMPTVNRRLGAPLATFVYGTLAPDTVHPQLNLIKGPPKTLSVSDGLGNRISYDPDFSGGEANLGGTEGDGTIGPDFEVVQTNFNTSQHPTIPSAKGLPFNSTTELPTYNIWYVQETLEKDGVKSVKLPVCKKHYGPVAATDDGARIRTDIDSEGSAWITATAQNVTARIRRMFPVSMDAAYEEDAQLHYPKPTSDVTVPPAKILARGGENCGFQIHFRHSSISQMRASKGDQVDGGIWIEWGAEALEKTNQKISNFSLQLSPGRTPILWFYHPVMKKWTSEFPLKSSQPFAEGAGEYSVYVHYVGPNMLIGFSEDPSTWNCFTPITEGIDYNGDLRPRIPKESYISLLLSNVTTSFQYGPSAFNNYHPELITSATDVTNGLHNGKVRVDFKTPESKQEYIDRDAMHNQFVQYRYSADRPINESDEVLSMWYGDWRANKDGEQTLYDEISIDRRGTGEPTAIDGVMTFSGDVTFKTTIEGPMYLQLRSVMPDPKLPVETDEPDTEKTSSAIWTGVPRPPTTTEPLVHALDDGDISSFLTGWTVTYNNDHLSNRSRMVGTAQIDLANLDTSPRGQRILAAIEENAVVFTLGAGYESVDNYFQGIKTEVSYRQTSAGTITTVHCTDILSTMLEDIPFRSQVYFGTQRYARIIEGCMAMSGLYDWYEEQVAPLGSALRADFKRWTDAKNVRLGIKPWDTALAQNMLNTEQNQKIITVVEPALQLIFDRDAFPILYWDPAYQRARLDWRNDPYFRDELRLYGQIEPENITYLPNSQEEREHGIIANEYSIDTSTKLLLAGLTVYGIDFTGKMRIAERHFDNAFSEDGLARIVRMLKAPNLGRPIGWVGYRKEEIEAAQKNVLPDQQSLELFAEKLTKFAQTPYQTIAFDCYVTKPLNAHGTFTVKAFVNGGEVVDTDPYLYKSVQYTFDKNENIITARVEGERAPVILSKEGGSKRGPSAVVIS